MFVNICCLVKSTFYDVLILLNKTVNLRQFTVVMHILVKEPTLKSERYYLDTVCTVHIALETKFKIVARAITPKDIKSLCAAQVRIKLNE